MSAHHSPNQTSATLPNLLGTSASFLRLKNRLPAVAQVERTTLLAGPTGSGKDVIARSLHAQSRRRDKAFVAVDCGALPEHLLEAELFGHSRGAFTGATDARPGLIRAASNGTLFLDEIDSLPAAGQAKLLRFLENGEYRPVGCDRPEHSNSWVIAATNQDLRRRVEEGRFRADLLYRLEVVRLDVPSLSQRETDALVLANHFLNATAGPGKHFTDGAEKALQAHLWPGNVRELRHRVEAAALFTDGPLIDEAALGLDQSSASYYPPFDATTLGLQAPPPVAEQVVPGDVPPLERELWTLLRERGCTLSEAVATCEQMLVRAALRAEGSNRTRAAKRLGINVRTIYKKIVA
jgi:DNA-binding NtrC family response regulator